MDRLGQEPPVTGGSDSEHREPPSQPYARRRTDPGYQAAAQLETLSVRELLEQLARHWLETRASLEKLEALCAQGAQAAAREEAQGAVQIRSQGR